MKKRILIIGMILALVAVLVVPLTASAANSGQTTVGGIIGGATVTMTAPSAIASWAATGWAGGNPNFGSGDNYGTSATPGTVTVNPGTSGVTSWTVTAACTTNFSKAATPPQTGNMYCSTPSTWLKDALMIGPDNTVRAGSTWVSGNTWNNAGTGFSYTGNAASGSLPLFAEQTITPTDTTPGSYSITISFTATCAP
jgi:hypothetical protein